MYAKTVLHWALLPFRANRSLTEVRYWKRSVVSKRVAAIVLVEHMGDIAACEPVTRYIKQKYPEMLVTWFVRKPYLDLVRSNPFIDRVFLVGCLTEWLWVRKWTRFDKVYELHLEGRVCPFCNIPLHKLKESQMINGENYYHHGGLLAAYSKGAGLPKIDFDPQIYISQSISKRIETLSLPERYIVFHALSNEESRDWLSEKWIELIKKLSKAWDGSFVEIGTRSAIPKKLCTNYVNLCGQLGILETAEVLRGASLFIGIDSGPAHLANAVGVPGVILLGKYRGFDSYIPYSGRYGRGEGIRIVSTVKEVGTLSVHDVERTILSMLKDNDPRLSNS